MTHASNAVAKVVDASTPALSTSIFTSSFRDDTLSPFDSTQAIEAVGHPEADASSAQLLGSKEHSQGMSPNIEVLQAVSQIQHESTAPNNLHDFWASYASKALRESFKDVDDEEEEEL